jgi:hypothetical protein
MKRAGCTPIASQTAYLFWNMFKPAKWRPEVPAASRSVERPGPLFGGPGRTGDVLSYASPRIASQFCQHALKGSHDAQDQRAYLRSLQWNGLPKGEAARAGDPQNLSDEVRGLCRQGKNYGADQLTRPWLNGFEISTTLLVASLRLVFQPGNEALAGPKLDGAVAGEAYGSADGFVVVSAT